MKLGLAFFALATLATAAYALNRGVYAGSDLHLQPSGYNDVPVWYMKNCKYLFPSGIHTKLAGGGETRREADKSFCPFFNSEFPSRHMTDGKLVAPAETCGDAVRLSVTSPPPSG